MDGATIFKKMFVRPGMRLLLLNAPQGYREMLEPLPAGITLETSPQGVYPAVHFFAATYARLEELVPQALASLEPDGLLWVSYPKKSSKVATDLNRDIGWAPLDLAGFRPVTQISIDDTWSALRFREKSKVGN